MTCKCEGCEVEFDMAVEYFKEGYDVGFNYSEDLKHWFFFALDPKTGEWIAG